MDPACQLLSSRPAIPPARANRCTHCLYRAAVIFLLPGIVFALLLATTTAASAQQNRPPVASDQSLQTIEDLAVNGILQATDADASALTYRIVSNGTKGVATISDPAAGTFTYTPNPDLHGVDTFAFRASDGTDDSNPATVMVIIRPINDAPVLTSIDDQTTEKGALLQLTACGTDIDTEDTLRFALRREPLGAVIDAITGIFRWTPGHEQPAGHYVLTVTLMDDGTPKRKGDAEEFAIEVINAIPRISVISPNGGEELTGGTKHNIQWSIPNPFPEVDHVRLSYSTNAFATRGEIATVRPPTAGSYSWSVPNIDSQTVTVRAIAEDANNTVLVFDDSNASFGITSTGIGNLSGHWRFEEPAWNGVPGEVADSSDHGHHGAAMDGATTTDGRYGRAGRFTGGSFVAVPESATLSSDAQVTIAAWINGDRFAAHNFVAGESDAWSAGGYGLAVTDTGSNARKAVFVVGEVSTAEACPPSGSGPRIICPVSGSVLAGTTATFAWTADGEAVNQWWLYVGAAGIASSELLNESQGVNLSKTISDLPTSGTIYVRLWYQVAGSWLSNDYTYTASIPAPTTEVKLLSVTNLATGHWYHLAGTYDGHAAKLYVNGVLENALLFPGLSLSNGFPFTVGRDSSSPFWPFDGRIDEVTVFDRALTADELLALAEGRAGIGNTFPVIDVPGPQTIRFGQALIFDDDRRIAIADPDADLLAVTLTVDLGTIALGAAAAVSDVVGDGTASISFTGHSASVNAALNGLTYSGIRSGIAVLTIAVNDRSNVDPGIGHDTESVAIAVRSQVQVSTRLIGHWRMDENSGAIVDDVSGEYNGGTAGTGAIVTTGVPANAAGVGHPTTGLGQARDFSGTATGVVEVADDDSFNTGLQITVAAWVNSESFAAYNFIAGKADIESAEGFGLALTDTGGGRQPVFVVGSATSPVDTRSGPRIVSPVSEAALPAPVATWTWTAGGVTIHEWWLYVGTEGIGSSNLLNGSQGASLSKTVSGLPTTGIIYVRLWYNGVAGWQWQDYTYMAGAGGTTPSLSATNHVLADTRLAPGQWYHVAGTYDGVTARIYVNGALEKSRTLSATVSDNAFPFTIGRDAQASYWPFDGKIDEVLVFATALTGDGIRILARGELPNVEVATRDLNRNGFLDALQLTFDRFAGDSSIAAAAMTISQVDNPVIDLQADGAMNNQVVYVTFGDDKLRSSELPSISALDGPPIVDSNGNPITPLNFLTIDCAPPIVLDAEFSPELPRQRVRYSERIDSRAESIDLRKLVLHDPDTTVALPLSDWVDLLVDGDTLSVVPSIEQRQRILDMADPGPVFFDQQPGAVKDLAGNLSPGIVDRTVAIAASSDDFARFSLPFAIGSTQPAYAPALAVSAAGGEVVYHLAYFTTFGPSENQHVYYMRSTDTGSGGNWSSPIAVSGNLPSQSHYDVAIAARNELVVVAWQRTATIYVARSTNAGAAFEPAIRVSNPASPFFKRLPKVAIDDNGGIHVVWTEGRDHSAFINHAYSPNPAGDAAAGDAGTWLRQPALAIPEELEVISGDGYFQPAIVTAGSTVYVAAQNRQSEVTQVSVNSRSISGGFYHTEFVEISSVALAGANPAYLNMTVDEVGNLYLVYADGVTSNPNIRGQNPIMFTMRRGTQWSAPVEIGRGYMPALAFSAAIVGGGTLRAVWYEPLAGDDFELGGSIVYREAIAPGTAIMRWNPPVNLTADRAAKGIQSPFPGLNGDFLLGVPAVVVDPTRLVATVAWVGRHPAGDEIVLAQHTDGVTVTLAASPVFGAVKAHDQMSITATVRQGLDLAPGVNVQLSVLPSSGGGEFSAATAGLTDANGQFSATYVVGDQPNIVEIVAVLGDAPSTSARTLVLQDFVDNFDKGLEAGGSWRFFGADIGAAGLIFPGRRGGAIRLETGTRGFTAETGFIGMSKTFSTPIDASAFNAISYWLRSDHAETTPAHAKLELVIGDGGGGAGLGQTGSTWTQIVPATFSSNYMRIVRRLDSNDFVRTVANSAGGGSFDLSNVTAVRLIVFANGDTTDSKRSFDFDDINFFNARQLRLSQSQVFSESDATTMIVITALVTDEDGEMQNNVPLRLVRQSGDGSVSPAIRTTGVDGPGVARFTYTVGPQPAVTEIHVEEVTEGSNP